jgi:hypothetical protein
MVNSKINQTAQKKKLPEDQQELIKIKIWNTFVIIFIAHFFKKRSEADIVKAANLSNTHFMDPA